MSRAGEPGGTQAVPARSIVRDGVALTYRVLGKGYPVLLAHPLTRDGTVFIQTGIASALAANGFMCIMPDAVGHGGSGVPDDAARYGLSEQARDALAVLDALGIVSCGMAGYSMGAWLVSGIAVECPERVDTALLAGWDVLEGARTFTACTGWEERLAEFGRIVRELTAADPVPPDAEHVLAWTMCYRQLFETLPSIRELRAAGVRIDLACGVRDPYLPNCRRASELLGARLYELPGNHVSAFVKPELLAVMQEVFDRARRGAQSAAPGCVSRGMS